MMASEGGEPSIGPGDTTGGIGCHCSVAFGSAAAGDCATAGRKQKRPRPGVRAANATYGRISTRRLMGFSSWSYRTQPDGFCERLERIAASRHELVRDIALIVQIRHGGSNCVVVEFLAVVDFMATGNAAGMKMSDPVDVVADRPDHIALHDLHMIDVVQQLHSRRVDCSYDRRTKRSFI